MKNRCIGIDLGTSNAALALCDVSSGAVETISIPQIVNPGHFEALVKLPTVAFIPPGGESGQTQLPWTAQHAALIGSYARERGAEVPDRTVSSAKSWLCYHQVDPKEPVLPWESEIEEGKISPFEASRLFLQHMKEALVIDERLESSLNETESVLTVPASFDELARSLTLEAAHAAGFEEVALLEEPLAAFYNWLARQGENWRKDLHLGDLLLVCDIGGGTADFTLILVDQENGQLALKRISVGNHILLGGDNMDLALALYLKRKFETEGQKLDQWQFLSLMHSSRNAKERLLSDQSIESLPVAVIGKGSGLFSKARTTALSRREIEQTVLDGFFPLDSISCLPKEEKRSGLMEFGLPFASDSAISHHLAAFLVQSAEAGKSNDGLKDRILHDPESGRLYLSPSHLLFNGGVFNAAVLRQRMLEILKLWNKGREIKELESGDYDLAVAHGAAFFARTRASGKGVRVKAGLSRSYYIGLERAALSAPGYRPPLRAICVAVQGMEEGSSAELPKKEFSLMTGEEVRFRFFSANGRSEERVGSIVDDAEDELEGAMDVRTRIVLPDGDQRQTVPVHLRSQLSDIGLLELWLHEQGGQGCWKLEINTRVEQ